MPRPTRRLLLRAALLAVAVAACGPALTPVPSRSGTSVPSSGTATGPPSATPPASAGASPTSGESNATFDPTSLALELQPIVGIPGAPLAIASPPDDTGRLFVTERGGRVWIVTDGQRAEQPFLDIATRVTAGGEQGLLGFAFHPSFPDDPRFFVYYTNTDRDQVVAERRLDPADPTRADRDYERPLLVMDDFAGNHNGGALAFGPDGRLYIATGDGGGAGDPQATGQRLDTLLGKILRIGVDPAGERPYTVPDDNPFVGRAGALPEIWHLGLRNPWRISFDRETDDLWIGDVGQGQWEEIDVARGNEGGRNFGWSVTEGRHCFREDGCSSDGLTGPVTEYSHDLGCSVTGGFVYRGTEQPSLRGGYVFADYCTGTVWAIDAGRDAIEQPTVVAESGRSISSFGEDATGELYATDLGGELLRVVVR